jgi:hypothetical protein
MIRIDPFFTTGLRTAFLLSKATPLVEVILSERATKVSNRKDVLKAPPGSENLPATGGD